MDSGKSKEHVHAEVDAMLHGEKGKGEQQVKQHHYKLIAVLVVVFTIIIGFGLFTLSK